MAWNNYIFVPIFILIFTSRACHVTALIPEPCAYNATKPMAVCCPIDPHHHMVCGGPERGFCQKISVPEEHIPPVFHMDDRLAWPLRFFSYACQCQGNYYGVACESCWFGWEGVHCDKKVVRIRRDIRTLNEAELNVFKEVYARSQLWPSGYLILDESSNWNSDPVTHPKFIKASVQYFAAFMHRYGSRSTLYKNKKDCAKYGILNFNHDGVIFPTWHRYFQLIWERMLAHIAFEVHGIKDFTVPYWDFVGLKKCDICTDKYMGAEGEKDADGVHLSKKSIFANFRAYCVEPKGNNTCFGCQAGKRLPKITRKFLTYDFPNQKDVDFMLHLEHYFIPGERDSKQCKSFHMALEGFCGRPDADPKYQWMHNKIHRMIDGSMCCTATATNDPIFILLHNFIDKLFNIWLRIHRPNIHVYPNKHIRPGHARDSFMIGFIPLARNGDMFTDSLDLGFDYDNMAVATHAQNKQKPMDFHKYGHH